MNGAAVTGGFLDVDDEAGVEMAVGFADDRDARPLDGSLGSSRDHRTRTW